MYSSRRFDVIVSFFTAINSGGRSNKSKMISTLIPYRDENTACYYCPANFFSMQWTLDNGSKEGIITI